MTELKFTKMQGCGNDFILIDDRESGIPEQKKGELAGYICQRGFSVGADGVLFLCKPTTSSYEVRMQVFNADGSEAEMCGNGMRCFAKYVYESGVVQNRRMKVETLAGLIVPEVEVDEKGAVTSIQVFMGVPEFNKIEQMLFVNDEIGAIKLTALSLGNPHAVVIVDSFDGLELNKVGKAIESHKAFSNKTNVDFVVRNAKREINVRTYERGVGETLSCGTGSTASVLTLNKLGYVNLNEPVIVHTKGGDLVVELKEEGAYLMGPAEEVYVGVVEVKME
uniref:Diaminopimelate epimerase n=1 Tax=Candidatus Methanophaga sp. ANME-1 ERB7 TaxID=2759913 RepID=A0A7G9Z3R5_9EURY|nr:diaminopimelate epimerase [Methanosarcinales archaeon ANME-1 ERB7]